MPRGRLPTGIVATTLSVAPSITVTVFPRSLETYTSGSAAACAATAARMASERSASLFTPRAIGRPPSGREPASAVRHRRAERVEILAADVGQDRERSEGRVVALARARHVERLPELMIPSAERERFTLV